MPDNRSHIMQIALELFSQRGYNAVGVQEIVEAASVTKPTLYHYFGSKQGLLEALVTERSASFVIDVTQAAAYDGDLKKSITALVETFFDFTQRHPAFYRMILAMWFAPPASEYYPVILTLQQQLFDPIDNLFVQAEQDHGNMRGRHRRYAVSLKGMMDTYIGLALQDQVNLDDNELVYRLVHEFMHGIFS